MDEQTLRKILDELRALPHETEWVEFKEASNDLHFDEIGRYFSAIANEANLRNKPCGWLVLGIVDKDRSIGGTRYREDPAKLDSLKQEIARESQGHTFIDIHVLELPGEGRVVMLEIPPAPMGIPVPFKGHFYGRNSESRCALSVDKFERIRGQVRNEDWSAVTCPLATLDDLSSEAIKVARERFLAKNSSKYIVDKMEEWSDEIFLDRAKFTINGQITRAAILLLGRPESTHWINPSVAQITWKLDGAERAYEHFGPPFLMATSELYARIRNTLQKVDVPGRLVPYEISKYEKWVILEALHNAIAHQDYTQQRRVLVTETDDSIRIENAGRFFDGRVSDYTLGDKTPTRYRNRFLVDAMVNVNMIDSMGYGIHRMFVEQRKRFYPLPDYDLGTADTVTVNIAGKVIDPSYTAVLMEKNDLPLSQVILLDRVQKRQRLEKSDVELLRREQLIEGRYPNVYVAAHVAAATGDRAQYIRNRAFDDQHYKAMVLGFLGQYGAASREDLDRLLLDKLSDVLTDQQKRNKIRNLRHSLVEEGVIKNEGSRRFPRYVLTGKLAKDTGNQAGPEPIQ